ncbi:LysR family transcriptional regulator [Caballeronia sp. LZ033]|uniref:LysR family transcriptional regulator n=1 Tax=Caballeronia sp. LZ033 TaxID=3038566 RepID=UPI0028586E8E|nr:LysR family transcriptional regulator [Caballeronia sp. LZ033]MDR5815704.1 LysR family transcriptional regulator [Caballeronia sp. LZ033]
MFDLTSLALFGRAVATGSLSRAAQQSHMSLSTASRRIALLEHHFRVTLLNRSSAGVEPTPAGEALARHATDLLVRTDAIHSEMADYALGAVGRVRVYANISAIAQQLPEQLRAFSGRYGDIGLHISEMRSVDILQALRDGRADIGVVTTQQPVEGLRLAPYCSDRISVLVPQDHALRGPSVDFAALFDHDLVALDDKSEITRSLVREAAALGRSIRFRVQVQSFEAMCRLIASGQGIGILPEGAVGLFLEPMRLRSVRLNHPWAARMMSVAMRAGAAPLPTQKLFDFLSAFASKPVSVMPEMSRDDALHLA